MHAMVHLLTYLLTYRVGREYKTGNFSETVEDRAKDNCLYKVVDWLSIAAKMYDLE